MSYVCFLLVYISCVFIVILFSFFFFKQKTAYEMRISDWSSDVCSSDLDARLRNSTATTPEYRLYALDTVPPKPGLVRVGTGGYAIQVEVYDLPIANIGVFLAGIASPLGIGTVKLENGETVHGFLREPIPTRENGSATWRVIVITC